MGNQQSSVAVDSKAVYKAVLNNELVHLEKCISTLRANRQLTPQELGFVDKEGRTPLLVAASKNYHSCARKLLENGADVNYLNPIADVRGGTALHEATRSGHEAMAELLLSFGASPFQCNALGKTCMDEAVLAGAGNLLRRFEHLAPWTGHLQVKSNTLAGMSSQYKQRYVVAMPLLPAPQPPSNDSTTGTGGQQEPPSPPLIRRQLWIYKDTTSLVPKCRVWLDGASVVRTGNHDVVLRLHASHKPPQGDVYHRYDRGYCIYLRTRDQSAGALAVLETFITAVNVPAISSTASSPALTGPYPLIPPAALAPSASLPALPAIQSTPAQPQLPSSSQPSSTSGAPSTALTPYGSSGGGAAGVGGTPASQPPTGSPAVLGALRNPAMPFVDTMNALPGETDAEFAQRLASAMTATTGQDQPSLHSQASLSRRPSPPSPHAPTPTPSAAPTSTPSADLPAGWGAAPASGLDEQPSAPPLVPSNHNTPTARASVAAAGIAGAIPIAGAPPMPGDDALCVICLSNPREAGYLHGSTLHRCVCRDCCGEIKVGEPCPLCRLPVERVVGVF